MSETPDPRVVFPDDTDQMAALYEPLAARPSPAEPPAGDLGLVDTCPDCGDPTSTHAVGYHGCFIVKFGRYCGCKRTFAAPLAAEDREPLREALRVLHNMSDDLADAVLIGVRPDDIGPADWEAANDDFRAALKAETPEPTLRARLTPLRGYPTDDGHGNRRWTPDRTGAYVGFEDVIDALATVRSTTPPEPEDGGT